MLSFNDQFLIKMHLKDLQYLIVFKKFDIVNFGYNIYNCVCIKNILNGASVCIYEEYYAHADIEEIQKLIVEAILMISNTAMLLSEFNVDYLNGDVIRSNYKDQIVEKQGDKMNSDNKPKIIFILGGPGSGKGTQCDIMTTKYGFIHYSTGDLLREFIKSDCEEAAKIRAIIAEGKLAPSEMLVDIIKRNIFKNGPNNKVYLIDGFPRSAENYEAWQKVIGADVDVRTLIYLECTMETLEARLLERGKSSGREDDNLQTIRKRFRTYNEQTMPFLEYYKRNVGQVHMLNGENSIEVVTGKIKEILINEHLLENDK